MADISFHHGTRVFEVADDVVPIRTAQSAVIYLQGTAPLADAVAFPLNTPILLKGASNYSLAAKLGDTGTLKKALDGIMDQGGNARLGAYVYINRVAQGGTAAETLSNMIGDARTISTVEQMMSKMRLTAVR